MNRRIRKVYVASMTVTVLLALLFIILMSALQISSLSGGLRAVLSAASAWTADSTADLNILARSIARSSPPLRVTFLLPEGIVLADSEESPLEMADFTLGPDSIAAIKNETGERLSFDGGLFYPALDMSGMVAGQLLIRLHYPLSKALGPLLLSLLAIPIVAMALLLWQKRTFMGIQRDLDDQLNRVRELLEGAAGGNSSAPDGFFPEIRPAMDTICRLIQRMQSDLETIRKTRDMRRDFIANASHELKNPLTAILGFAEMLGESAEETPQQRAAYLRAILEEGARMMSVISDILMLEKQEDDPNQDYEETDLAVIAQEVKSSLLPLCRKKGISISVQGDTTIRALAGDMRELLENLMGNAVRYGREGGWVKVLLEPDRIIVQDNGIGISEDKIPLVFEPFYRVDSPDLPKTSGTGLGLPIALRIARKYGGTIHVDSIVGEGSAFTVSFVRNT